MTIAEFFPIYMKKHLDPRCRWMHFHGINAGILVAVAAIYVTGYWSAGSLGVLTGYAFSIPSHKWYEGNQAASFMRPRWLYMPLSFASDWIMWWKIWRGEITISNPYWTTN